MSEQSRALLRASFGVVGLMTFLSRPCVAQTWAQVDGGAFAVSATALADVQSTLQQKIAALDGQDRRWNEWLLQYKAVKISGRRLLEIHGSCQFSGKSFNKRFYDEGVADGGHCFFRVLYDIESKRYSNVLFNGFAYFEPLNTPQRSVCS